MKMTATGLFFLMILIYIVSRALAKDHPFFGYIVAFSEAAMVGALADWFAVVALFRYPAGIPVPHTAIIPKNKDRIGENLAAFIKENFLSRDVLEHKLRSIDFAGRIAGVLSDEKRSREFCEKIIKSIKLLFEGFDDKEMRRMFSELVTKSMRKINVYPLLGKMTETLTENNRHQVLLDEALSIAERLIKENRQKIQEGMKRENPWWMPDFVDEVIFNKIVNTIEETLANIRKKEDHEIRLKFSAALKKMIEDLKDSDSFRNKMERMKNEFFSDPQLRTCFADTWNDIKGIILSEISRPETALRAQMEEVVATFGKGLAGNHATREKINGWIHTSIVNITTQYADGIITIISDTVRKWDADKTSRTIELHIGKDLQWIRINGTIVGGLVGLLIYILSNFIKG
ncbi:MAG: hypothetical protein A4E64_01534 [Syntrophorhabdus sp. PtaU1.Bin058]|nr:MAG: hypothetical protein A4E64_01534 [Syntrophorhabdus sp. PtaU1.Bin058]